jgi:site-specific DNA-methyltransferase (adenine-specific)
MVAMAGMRDKQHSLALVDPPYGIERFKHGSLRFDKVGKYNNGIQWDNKPTKEYFNELFRVSEFQIIWGANNFELPPTEYFVIWNKMQTVDNFATCEYAWTNCKKPARMFNYSIHKHNQITKIHPTEKQVRLYQWLLKNYAKPGDKILDTHGGSMSIAIACDIMGYDLDLYEIDADYFEAGKKRLERHQSQGVLF